MVGSALLIFGAFCDLMVPLWQWVHLGLFLGRPLLRWKDQGPQGGSMKQLMAAPVRARGWLVLGTSIFQTFAIPRWMLDSLSLCIDVYQKIWVRALYTGLEVLHLIAVIPPEVAVVWISLGFVHECLVWSSCRELGGWSLSVYSGGSCWNSCWQALLESLNKTITPVRQAQWKQLLFPQSFCEPQSYRPMHHEDFKEDLKRFRTKSRTWAGEKSKRELYSRLKKL